MYNKILGSSNSIYTKETISLESGIMDYINNHYNKDALIIFTGGDNTIFFEGDPSSDVDVIPEAERETFENMVNALPCTTVGESKDKALDNIYRNVYDYRLVQLMYKVDDNKFQLMNIKKLGNKDARMMGLLSNVYLLTGWIDKGIKKAYDFSEKYVNKIPFFINSKMDFNVKLDDEESCKKVSIKEARILDRVAKFAQDSYDKYLPDKTVIWIPIWKVVNNIDEYNSIKISLFDRIDLIIS